MSRETFSIPPAHAARVWGPREVLNELKWRHHDLDAALIHYVHRGAPDDTRIIPGSDVLRLDPGFLILRDRRGEASIPYHRVFRIDHRGAPVWERGRRDADP